jgi:MUN domain
MSTTYIENWFAPFIYKWLKGLSKKTVGWVQHSVRADTFIPDGTDADGVPLHSSSITDVFVAIYAELEFITNLQWSDPLQNGQFFQAFAKVLNMIITLSRLSTPQLSSIVMPYRS